MGSEQVEVVQERLSRANEAEALVHEVELCLASQQDSSINRLMIVVLQRARRNLAKLIGEAEGIIEQMID